MSNLISSISGLIIAAISKTGYVGVFVLSALESAAIPIPSEIVVPFSGFLAATGRFNLAWVVIVATVANLTGSLVLYWLAKMGGRWILEKYGKYVFIGQHELEVGDEWFKKYGPATIFWGRMLPVVRTFISLPAGVARMNTAKFTLYTLAGSAPWNFALALVGFKLGENWNVLHKYFSKFDILILLLIIGAAAWFIYRQWRHGKESQR